METLKNFFMNLTLFQWLALIAFIFGCISVSNALLSLKSRYRDWRGTNNKRQFDKRLKQFEKDAIRIHEFLLFPQVYWNHFFAEFMRVVLCLVSAVLFYCLGFFVDVVLGTRNAVLLYVITLVLVIICFNLAVRLTALTRRVNSPGAFTREILEFLQNAKTISTVPPKHSLLITIDQILDIEAKGEMEKLEARKIKSS